MFVAWIFPTMISILVGVIVAASLYGFKLYTWNEENDSYARRTGEAAPKPKFTQNLGMLLLVSFLFLGVWSGLDSFTTLDSGYVGVVTRYGEVTGKVLLPGLNWKTPHVEKVIVIATRNRTYQTAGDSDGTGDFNDYPIDTNTSDGQRITATYNATFFVTPDCASYVVTEFSSLENLVNTVAIPKFRSISRNEMKDFTAEELQQLASLTVTEDNTLEALQAELSFFCITVTSFDIRDIDFDPDYLQAIEDQQIAEEAIQTAAFFADAVEESVRGQVTQANGDAQELLIDAQARADAQVILSQAQAEAIELVGKQLSKYPSYTQYSFVEGLGDNVNWGILPDGMLPLIQLDNISQ